MCFQCGSWARATLEHQDSEGKKYSRGCTSRQMFGLGVHIIIGCFIAFPSPETDTSALPAPSQSRRIFFSPYCNYCRLPFVRQTLVFFFSPHYTKPESLTLATPHPMPLGSTHSLHSSIAFLISANMHFIVQKPLITHPYPPLPILANPCLSGLPTHTSNHSRWALLLHEPLSTPPIDLTVTDGPGDARLHHLSLRPKPCHDCEDGGRSEGKYYNEWSTLACIRGVKHWKRGWCLYIYIFNSLVVHKS